LFWLKKCKDKTGMAVFVKGCPESRQNRYEKTSGEMMEDQI
jgi:hypothetical protein